MTRQAIAALTLAAVVPGCATTQYQPAYVARGELTLRQGGGLELWAGGQRVAKGVRYRGLDTYVRCVPEAHTHARQARSHGAAAVTLSALGGVFGVAGLGGLYGIYDRPNILPWLLGGVGVGALGLTFSLLSWRSKSHANGHAVDAMNYYNDAVGSLGATCDDLTYPPPAGPGEPTVSVAPAPAPATAPAPAVPGPATEPPALPPPPVTP